ncbi:hypothetical protein ScPMuIL_016594 [Solemya velum]
MADDLVMEEVEVNATCSSTTKTETPTSTQWLPPCRICGEKASGFHYGVNTCEACKGFFRRSLKREKKYKCILGSKNCNIGFGKRSACSACRYQKCCEFGMSKKAIRTGRYTHEKRTRNVNEVKTLKQGSFTINDSDATDKLPSEPDVTEERVDTGGPSGSVQDTVYTDEELLLLIESLTDTQARITVNFALDEEELEKIQKDCVDRHRLEKEVFGNLPGVSDEEHRILYSATGIDVDNRLEIMKSFADNMDTSIRKLVVFAKTIPGFTSLHLDDQVNLVKTARFEWGIVGFHKLFNLNYGVITFMYKNESIHFEDLKKILHGRDDGFQHFVLETVLLLKQMNLSLAEMAVIRGIVLTFVDRCTLHDRYQVEQMNWKLVCCLRHLVEKNRTDDKLFLAKIFQLFCRFRELSSKHENHLKVLSLEWPIPMLQEYPLLAEMML